MANPKITVLSLLLIGVLGIVLLLEHQSLVRVRTENTSLQQQLEELRTQKDQLAAAQTENAELEKQKLRRAQSELLRLRAEVTGLRDATQNAARVMTNAPPVPETAAPEGPASAVKLQASIRTQLAPGHTLMTGGWVSEPGKRIFLFATPRLQGANADQVQISTRIVELPEPALSKVGLDAFTVDGNESSLNQVIPPEDVEALMKELEGIEGAKLFAQQGILTSNGRQAEIRTMDQQVGDGSKPNLGPTINIVPVISADKTTIDMTLQAGMNRLAK